MIETLLLATFINCSYNLNGPTSLAINTAARTITYSSRQAGRAIFIPISDISEMGPDRLLSGDLPAPWMKGSSYRIRLQQNSPFSVMTFVGPTGNLANVRMVCR